ncbi:hypothetical protein BDV96DRAFT_593095 [Lophiotrema nucula]|uniref:Uncharacterized protein n=1 Tax=Lophiotrema nucula TaxID=690887 RepID=A0A6A5ZSU4_9PLEO|nr:hypothetical protein BDV96DRAFT_593095 [Lophiotrema nucula]
MFTSMMVLARARQWRSAFLPPNTEKREDEHARTGSKSTGWLASLVLSGLNWRWYKKHRKLPGQPCFDGYSLHFNVICLLADKNHAALAEIILACVARAYFWTGLGLNVAHCGQVGSVWNTADGDWEDWRRWILENTDMAANIFANVKLVEEKPKFAAQIEEERAQIHHKRQDMEKFIGLVESMNLDHPAIPATKRKEILDSYEKAKKFL